MLILPGVWKKDQRETKRASRLSHIWSAVICHRFFWKCSGRER
jgi:hypothetical protein